MKILRILRAVTFIFCVCMIYDAFNLPPTNTNKEYFMVAVPIYIIGASTVAFGVED